MILQKNITHKCTAGEKETVEKWIKFKGPSHKAIIEKVYRVLEVKSPRNKTTCELLTRDSLRHVENSSSTYADEDSLTWKRHLEKKIELSAILTDWCRARKRRKLAFKPRFLSNSTKQFAWRGSRSRLTLNCLVSIHGSRSKVGWLGGGDKGNPGVWHGFSLVRPRGGELGK